jgi:sensor histidine kinase YesM
LYEFSENILISERTVGDLYPFVRREVNSSYPALNIAIPKGKERQFLMEIYSMSDFSFPLILYSQEGSRQSTSERTFVYGLYLGLMFIITLFNLFMYISMKHTVYLIYSLYLLFVGLTQSALFGDPLAFLYGNNFFLAKYDLFLFGPGVLLFGAEFFISYFSLRNGSLIYRTVRITQLITLIAVPLSLIIKPALSFDLMSVINFWACLLALGVAGLLAKRGSRLAQIYLVGWSVFLLGSIIFILQSFELIPYSHLSNYAMPAGTVFEALILSFAVGYRMKILSRKSDEQLELIHQQKEVSKRLAHQAEHAEIQFLQSQMNPHFLFNALNTIQNFIRNKDHHKASFYLGNVSGLLRTSLDILDGQMISLEKELSFITEYLRAESLRYNQKFSYRIICEEPLEPYEILLPPYLIQPFIENSIKHAFSNEKANPEILVRMREDAENNRLIISVEDNGKGMDSENVLSLSADSQKKYTIRDEDYLAVVLEKKQKYRIRTNQETHAHRGIELVIRRLEILNKINPHFESKLEFHNGSSGGFMVIINLPIILYQDDKYSNN